MDLKASIDVGQNLTQLLEKLAKQIGTTADKVFPWYVGQSIIEGYTFFALLCIALIIGSVLLITSYKKERVDRNGDPTIWLIPFIVGCIFIFVSSIVLFVNSADIFFSILTIITILLFIFFVVLYVKVGIKQYRIDKALEKQWDEWDRIKGSFDIIIAERGGKRR